MALTYTPIATYTVSGSAVASYTFTSIPTTYTDLVLVANLRSTNTNGAAYVQVGNGSVDTGANYSATQLVGTGSAATSNRDTNRSQVDDLMAALSTSASGTFSVNVVHIMNYSNTTTYKTVLIRANDANQELHAAVSTWRSTSAINTLLVKCNGNTDVGSSFTLYGIKSA